MNKRTGTLAMGSANQTQVTTLAARKERLVASITDIMLMLLVAVPAMFFLEIPKYYFLTGEIPIERIEQLLAINFAGFMAFHGYLLSRCGQTVGKRLMKIAIVDMHGHLPSMKNLIFIRYLPLWLMLALPFLLLIIPILDNLPILHRNRRCLHDMLASTRVVRVPR